MVQDEKLALANAVKQALSTARDAAQDDGDPAAPDRPARAPRPTADRVGSSASPDMTSQRTLI